MNEHKGNWRDVDRIVDRTLPEHRPIEDTDIDEMNRQLDSMTEHKPKKKRVCIGYGEFERRCQNPAGSRHSDLWCQRCDDLRMASLNRDFAKIRTAFGLDPTEHKEEVK